MNENEHFDFQKYNPTYTRGTSHTLKNTSTFFKKIQAKAEAVAEKIVEDRAKIMVDVLRYRKSMPDFARYPKYDVPEGTIQPHKHSYMNWKLAKVGKNIQLINTTKASDGFSYPLLLLNGQQGSGSYQWPFKLPTDKVNSEGFSTQMPNGIQPFLNRHKQYLLDELRLAYGKIT